MVHIIEEYNHLSYEEKRKKILFILKKFSHNTSLAPLYNKISTHIDYPERRLDKIYTTLMRYAIHKKSHMIETIQQQRKQYTKKTAYIEEQEQAEADILLDTLLDDGGV